MRGQAVSDDVEAKPSLSSYWPDADCPVRIAVDIDGVAPDAVLVPVRTPYDVANAKK
jgi:hypothetical protein